MYGVVGKDGDARFPIKIQLGTRLLNIAAPRGGYPLNLFSDYR